MIVFVHIAMILLILGSGVGVGYMLHRTLVANKLRTVWLNGLRRGDIVRIAPNNQTRMVYANPLMGYIWLWENPDDPNSRFELVPFHRIFPIENNVEWNVEHT